VPQEISSGQTYPRRMDAVREGPLVRVADLAAESEGDEWQVGDWFVPRPSRPLHSVRCDSTSRSTGERCRRWATLGARKCAKHGGLAGLPNVAEYRAKVLEQARLELLAAAGDAVGTLVRIANDEDAPRAVRVKAAAEILDRAGVHKGTELQITTPAQPEISPSELIRARLDRLAAASRREAAERQIDLD
jgi:hypothetical protein